MAYTIEIADAVAKTVGKFVSLNAHQLAGHLANLEFWQSQVKNALDATDGYDSRQHAREGAQKKYISTHDTRQFNSSDAQMHREFPGEEYYDLPRAQPDRHRIDKELLRSKRRDLADGFYDFIRRCYQSGLITKDAAVNALATCGMGAEPGDFSNQD